DDNISELAVVEYHGGILGWENKSFPSTLRLFVGQASRAEQGSEFLEFFGRQMTELPDVAFAQRLAQLPQERPRRVGNADADDSAVFGGPITLDQPALLQFVQEASNVRSMRNKPASEVQGLDFVRMFAAKEAQGVVLLRREIVPAE